MPRSQRHLVEQQGYASNGETSAQGVTSSDTLAAPAQFEADGWSVADDTTGGAITISITELPSEGASAITDIEYQLDDGDWVSGELDEPGEIAVTDLVDDQEYSVRIRAVNATGEGPASDAELVTPTTA